MPESPRNQAFRLGLALFLRDFKRSFGGFLCPQGLRSSNFLDDVAKLLAPSKFASPQLTKILSALASWAAQVSGSDADGKVKLSEDVPRSIEAKLCV